MLWILKSRFDSSIFYSDFLETANNAIPKPDNTTGIIQVVDWALARIRLVASIGIISPPIAWTPGISVISGTPPSVVIIMEVAACESTSHAIELTISSGPNALPSWGWTKGVKPMIFPVVENVRVCPVMAGFISLKSSAAQPANVELTSPCAFDNAPLWLTP